MANLYMMAQQKEETFENSFNDSKLQIAFVDFLAEFKKLCKINNDLKK